MVLISSGYSEPSRSVRATLLFLEEKTRRILGSYGDDKRNGFRGEYGQKEGEIVDQPRNNI
jgi:hypothetical protein